MSEHVTAGPRPRLPVLLRVLAGVVLVEALAMGAVTVLLLVGLLTQPSGSVAGGIALVVLAVLAVAWLATMSLGILRGRPWTRGASFTWQLIQLALAVGSFQEHTPVIGWLLLVPSVVAIALLFTPSVMNATRRPS